MIRVHRCIQPSTCILSLDKIRINTLAHWGECTVIPKTPRERKGGGWVRTNTLNSRWLILFFGFTCNPGYPSTSVSNIPKAHLYLHAIPYNIDIRDLIRCKGVHLTHVEWSFELSRRQEVVSCRDDHL